MKGKAFACLSLHWRFSERDSHLAFATQSSEKLVAFELGFLIGHDARHLEHEPGWPRLLVEAHSVERQYADARVVAHRVHHPCRGYADDGR